MDIVTIQSDEPFDPAAAQAELEQLRRQVTARLIANVCDFEAAQAAAAQLDALTIDGDREARHGMAALVYVAAGALLGGCCVGGALLAWAYYLGRP